MSNKSVYVKAGITGCLVAAFAIFFWHITNHFSLKEFGSILSPFFFGGALAYLLTPLCNKLEKWLSSFFKHPNTKHKEKLIKKASIAISILAAILIITFVCLLIIPQLYSNIMSFAMDSGEKLGEFNNAVLNAIADKPQLVSFWDTITQRVEDKFDSWINDDILTTAQSLLVGVSGIVQFLKNIIIGMIISVYILGIRKAALKQTKRALSAGLSPSAVKFVKEEAAFADKMFSGFFRGKLLDSIIIGIICFVFMKIVGIESSILISTVIGITNIIPFFGPFIGGIPCTFLVLLDNPMHAFIFGIFIIVLQQVDGNIIGPKILGDSTGLNSFWVLFAILFFGGLWGFVGMLIGVPVMGVIQDIARKLISYGLEKRQVNTDAD